MVATHLDHIVDAMSHTNFYPHPVDKIEKIETHISIVFLTGAFVYKIKKPVDLQFLDFTDLEKRRICCRAELTLNRRLSGNVYLKVLPITISGHAYQLAGKGKIVEYTVRMVQLSRNKRLDKCLRSGKLEQGIIDELARKLADFYKKTTSNPEITALGKWEIVWKNCAENFEQIDLLEGKKSIDGDLLQIIRAATRSFMTRHRHLFDLRVSKGRIKDCHGDLKSEHIYLTNPIQIIDCIEFNDRFRFSDISADLAFLAMDLDFRGQSTLAQTLIDSFLDNYEDPELLILLAFYKCYRAMVRVKVNFFQMQGLRPNDHRKGLLERDARRYLELAYQYAAQFTRSTVWVVCGLPASGKSTVAAALAAALGIRIISSDITRKELFHILPATSGATNYGDGIYTENATALTYGKMLLQVQEMVEKGDSVILDATYSRKTHRSELVRLARDMDVNLMFIHCWTRLETLRQRLQERESRPGISDARAHHLEAFIRQFESMEEIPPQICIEIRTDYAVEKNLKRILMHDAAILSHPHTECEKYF